MFRQTVYYTAQGEEKKGSVGPAGDACVRWTQWIAALPKPLVHTPSSGTA